VFSIHFSVNLPQCVRLQVSTTMLPLMLLSSMLAAACSHPSPPCVLQLDPYHETSTLRHLAPIPRAKLLLMLSPTTVPVVIAHLVASGARPRQPCRQ
jgi:hypothetical protein